MTQKALYVTDTAKWARSRRNFRRIELRNYFGLDNDRAGYFVHAMLKRRIIKRTGYGAYAIVRSAKGNA